MRTEHAGHFSALRMVTGVDDQPSICDRNGRLKAGLRMIE